MFNIFYSAIWAVALTCSAAFAQVEPVMGPVNPEFEEYIQSLQMVKPQNISETKDYGHIPLPVIIAPRQENKAVKTEVLPEKFDLRELDGVTSVKDQGSRGSCWTFGAMGTMESYLKYTYGTEYDFSEMNLANNSGFDGLDGGHAFMSMAYLSRGDGPIDENEDPYDVTRHYSPIGIEKKVLVTDMVMIANDQQSLKKALMEYGALECGMYFDASCYDSDTNSYFYGGDGAGANHEIIIVGWDDNYSASEFTDRPEGDGAWICKNSWGDQWGENGFFYISYYDGVLAKNAYYDEIEGSNYNTDILTYKVDENSEYKNIYQYDPLGCTWNCGYNSEEAFFANIFECETSAETLDAVGFYTLGYDSEYEIYIVENCKSSGDLFQDRDMVASGTIENGGYHTVELGEEIHLVKGQEFAVIVKLSTPGQMYPVAIEHEKKYYSSSARAYEGESFISENGTEWEDVSKDNGFNVCLKAYSKNLDDVEDESAFDFSNGMNLYNQNDYEGGLELFQLAIEKNPNKGIYYFYEGKCFQELSDIDAALDSFDRGIALSDDYFEKLNIAKGDMLVSCEDYENALERYEDAISVRKSEIALYGKATCLSEMGRFEEACLAYEDLMYLGYSYKYVIGLAQCYFEAGRYEDCMYRCDEAVSLNPKSIKAPMIGLKVCFEREDYFGFESYMDDMQAVYDEYWKEEKYAEVEDMMCEAYAIKAELLFKRSYCGKALKALEESGKYGECQMADDVRSEIDEELNSYEVFSADALEVGSDHVFTVKFNKKVNCQTIDGNIFIVDSDGNIVETSAYIYGAWYEVRVNSKTPYGQGNYAIYIEPSLKDMGGESLSSGVKVNFSVVN